VLAVVAMTFAPGFAKALDVVSGVYGAGQNVLIGAAPFPAYDPNAVQPFVLNVPNPAERATAVGCLADAIYYEAGFEPLSGQRAVAQVIVNRVRDPNFPASVCGVVFEGYQRRTGCQFSFVCDGSMKRRPPHPEQEAFARMIADQALSGYVEKEVGTATHYHTDYVHPNWASNMVEVAQIGQHIFYHWRGRAGEPSHLSQPYKGGEVQVWQMAASAILGHPA
jgi:spore germination cell wall hydrolase CwlJ-like protein